MFPLASKSVTGTNPSTASFSGSGKNFAQDALDILKDIPITNKQKRDYYLLNRTWTKLRKAMRDPTTASAEVSAQKLKVVQDMKTLDTNAKPPYTI